MSCGNWQARAVPHDEPAGSALVVFDLDGTITRSDTLIPFLLACLWSRPWRWPRLLLLPPLALRFAIGRDRGRFKGALIHWTLGGLARVDLESAAGAFVGRLLRRGVFGEALQAVAEHRARGERLVLMSASVDLYVPLIAHALGFAETICSKVRWRPDGRLDGRLATANCYGEEKRRCLQALIARESPRSVAAYGNSRSDLAHMRLAQQAYLINGPARLADASPGLRALHWSQRGAGV
jgi:phosphatidylglycerophosphatase C